MYAWTHCILVGQPMRFDTKVRDSEVPSVLRKFIRLGGRDRWRKRLEWVQRELKKPTGMQHFSRERWWMEIAFADVWRRYKRNSPDLVNKTDAKELSFLNCALAAVRCHARLSPMGRNRLNGMLVDATKQQEGLGPFAYEMKIATHLMHQGYDVEFHDAEGGSGFDYMATKNGACAEIECKFMSGDLGRKVHLMSLAQFSEEITPAMIGRLSSLDKGLFVRLTVPDRLEGEVQRLALAALVKRVVERRGTEELSDGTRAEVQEFDVRSVTRNWASSVGLAKAQIDISLRKHFGLDNNNVLIYVQPGKNAIVVVVESAQKDHVLDGMLGVLKRAAKRQFSGQLPGILCCHLADLSQEQLLSLSQDAGAGLNPLASELFDRRPHVYSVTFTASDSVHSDSHMVTAKGPAYTFKNDDHAQYDDSRLSIFSEGWP